VPEAVAPEPKGEAIALDIVYEDDDIVVINKPKGSSSCILPPAMRAATLVVNALICPLRRKSTRGLDGVRRPGNRAPRRDKDTTGLMVGRQRNDQRHINR